MKRSGYWAKRVERSLELIPCYTCPCFAVYYTVLGETPDGAAACLGLDFRDLLEWNRPVLPGLTRHARLKVGRCRMNRLNVCLNPVSGTDQCLKTLM
jgi:hypothetical protein